MALPTSKLAVIAAVAVAIWLLLGIAAAVLFHAGATAPTFGRGETTELPVKP